MDFLSFKNCESVALANIPVLEFADFRDTLKDLINCRNCRVSVFTVHGGKLYAVLLDPAKHCFKAGATAVGASYPALTNDIPGVHWFEREIFEQCNVIPENHPWLKPIRSK